MKKYCPFPGPRSCAALFIILFSTCLTSALFGQSPESSIIGVWRVFPAFSVACEEGEMNVVTLPNPLPKGGYIMRFNADGTGSAQGKTTMEFTWSLSGNRVVMEYSGMKFKFANIIKIIDENIMVFAEPRQINETIIAVFIRDNTE